VVQNFVIDIKAVNNPPNITFLKGDLEINEDFSIVLAGASISDPDINEMACAAEPCESQEGNFVMRVGVRNGSISLPQVYSPEILPAFVRKRSAPCSRKMHICKSAS